ncbi:DNA integrity scanning protein DisA nucleotide-binding domain protein [Desulfosoma caldarium]|uniref:DisA checkpoint controller-like protein n=1 Tax=Desulfosoma caldarium TaxID=610254 RepID=A0A3N1UKQ2_9BACT|nr:DNA integrity scanning protein DisA nucleotide-binding domain protein [Desulfosoma caldarium]ROQ90703.1 DisA checkpoint controller-like protein [Desulfosoma caldarium]
MGSKVSKNALVFNVLQALREGLTHFSGPSRVALVYAEKRDDPMRVCDPEDLLRGHEPKLKELYIDSDTWRTGAPDPPDMQRFGHIFPEPNLHLSGLISFGGRSRSIFYQMWFTEHHPDMCSILPTERWLEHAAYLLSHDFATARTFLTDSSHYVLREYATHAVHDALVDSVNFNVGRESRRRIYPILDAVLELSKTPEEGAWPRGKLVFVEESCLDDLHLMAVFPEGERPNIGNAKHIRKILLAVEHSDRWLVSDGRCLMGIGRGPLPQRRISAEFFGGYGFLRLDGETVCSFSEGRFYSSNRRAKLVQLEEALLTSDLDSSQAHTLFQIVANIVHGAQDRKHGCTLVLDLDPEAKPIPGHQLKNPLDLQDPANLDLAKSLSKMDGALHIGADAKLYRFACLLDGHSVPGEDRARGARYNSALRFSAEHHHTLIVVVSSDRPVSVIHGGVELSATCPWRPTIRLSGTPPTLSQWITLE